MPQVRQLIRQFDLFAKPFAFYVDGKRNKSTLVGGVMSLCILFVSLTYTYYLLNEYIDNKIQPKLTYSIAIENDMTTIKINDNFFILEMFIGGEPLKRYEKRVGKQFLTYKIFYEQYGKDGTSKYDTLELEECSDPQFDGFLCLPQSVVNGKDLYYQPIEKLTSDYAIMIIPCEKEETDNCATQEEINDVIFKPTNYFQLFTKIVQYNTNERQYITSYRQEYFYFDQKLFGYTRLDMFKGTTTVTEGMLIQKTETRDTIYDYKRIDTFFTNDDSILDRVNVYGYACILYEISEVHNYIYVQHATIAEVLSQFISIFNSMLLIGAVVRMFAQSNIVEDINNILLKEYYKQTALKLVKRQEGKQILIRMKNDQKKQKNQNRQKNISNLSQKDEFNKKSKQEQTVELQNKICETNFSENQDEFFQLSPWQKLKICILSLFGKPSLINIKPDKNSDAIIYKNLISQSMKTLNILELYKDLIKLKMAIKLVLTKDQYAAIHFCGSDLALHQQLQSKIELNQNIQENNNHRIQNNNNNNNIQSCKDGQLQLENPNLQQPKLESQTKYSLNVTDCKTLQNINSQAFLNNTISNETQQMISETIIQSTKNKKLENLQKQNLRFIEQYNLRNSNTQNIPEEKQQINQIEYKTSFNNKNEVRGKKNKQIELRDKVQNLNLRGDEYTIDALEESIQDVTDLQKDCAKKFSIIQNKHKLFKQKSCLKFHTLRHLQEMDKIEEDVSQREKFLQEFLEKMSKQGDTINPDISHIDKQIYSSLIFNDTLI